MALSRSYLKGMGLTDEQVGAIIEAHVETVDGLKSQITAYKTDAESLQDVKKELETLKGEDWKAKYDSLKEEYDTFKSSEQAKATLATKRAAYEALLKEAGVSEKRLGTILKVTDLNGIELDKNGAVKDASKVTESIKTEWADFITAPDTSGVNTKTPPGNDGGSAFDKMSLADKMTFANSHPESPEVKNWLKH